MINILITGETQGRFLPISEKNFFLFWDTSTLFKKKKKKQKTPLRKEYLLNSHNSFIQLALEEFQAVAKTQDDTQVQS